MLGQATVQEVLNLKGNNQIHSIRPEDTVFSAIRKMALHNIGALLVMEGEQILGIVTERDYARKVILKSRYSVDTLVHEVMEADVLYAIPDDRVESCFALMTEKRVRHLPVLQDGQLLGLISMGDIVKSLTSDQEFMIDQLTSLVTGSYGHPIAAARNTFKARLVEAVGQ